MRQVEWPVLTITAHRRSYEIADPGAASRVGAALRRGVPYERLLLEEVYDRQLHGGALDVGAHVGNHALWLAAICGLRVVAVEPDPVSFQMLKANVELNEGIDVVPVFGAFGRTSYRGELTRTKRVHAAAQGTVDVAEGDVALAGGLLLDEPLAVVKVDVEGGEADVLSGLSRHLTLFRPLVYAEAHNRTADEAIGRVLEPLGYRQTGVLRMGSPMGRWEAT